MMQPRDAHDDGDCAMEEAGALLHSSPLPAVMTNVTTKTDASSPGSSSNQQPQHQQTNEEISKEAADAALVGARKRKAIRVVKHQQVSVYYSNLIETVLNRLCIFYIYKNGLYYNNSRRRVR